MAEQRLIDANKLIEQLDGIISDYTSNGAFPNGYDINSAIDSLTDAPTIDPESLPIVRQLREELALITQQRDIYKSVFEHITSHGDCNDCEDAKGCRFAPGIGEDTRYNCPLWRGPQKEAHQ